MKKIFTLMGLVASASILLTNCSRNLDIRSAEKGSFSIIALTGDTKTANDGLDTKWVALDSISVFHAEEGTTEYGSNDHFGISSENLASGCFTGTLTSSLDESKGYDWYAIYPVGGSKLTTPANTSCYFNIGCMNSSSTAQVQNGNNSTAHLCGQYFPMVAQATGISGEDCVSLTFNNVVSIVKFHVTNNTTSPLTVTDISLTAEQEDIIGSYYINFAGKSVVFKSSGSTHVSNAARLSVADGEAIANGASADFYMAIKPFTNAADKSLTVSVNGTEKTITSAATFAPGVIKTINFNYDKTTEVPTYASLAELVAAGAPTAAAKKVNVTLTNDAITFINYKTVKFVANSQEVTIYGGVAAPTTWKVGGYVSGTLTNCDWVLYGGSTWELAPSNWDALSCINPIETPVIQIVNNSATITCATDGATIRYTLDGTDPTETSTEYTAAVAMTDGQTIKAKAFKTGMPASAVASASNSKTRVLIIDGSTLASTATTAASTKIYKNSADSVSVEFSSGAKYFVSTKATKNFAEKSIFIGKKDTYIHNLTAIPGKITKFEIYSNYGASIKVSVGVNFSDTEISAYNASASNTYTATLSTADSVYDCSSSLPAGAKYFWYQVTNANNSQVQFRITYVVE